MPPVIAAAGTALASTLAATPLISAIGFGGIITLSNTIVALGVGVAASAAASALSKTQTDKVGSTGAAPLAGVNAPEVRASVKAETPPLRLLLGETRSGGDIIFYKAAAPYLYVQQVYSFLGVSEFRELFIGDRECPLDSNGEPLVSPWLTSGGSKRLKVETQLGGSLAQTANTLITGAGFSGIDSDFRIPGMANCAFRYHYGSNFEEHESLWGTGVAIPDAQWIIRGVPVYDPRDPSQVLPSDLRDIEELFEAMATWKWSNTAALVQAFWAMMPFGLNAGPDRIRWDRVAASADFDEEIVPLNTPDIEGRTFAKRHTIDGVVKLSQKPIDIMEAMLTANRGFITPGRGQVRIESSQPVDPLRTITDGHIVGGFSFRDRKPLRERVNIGHGTFVSPERSYGEAQGPSYEYPGGAEADGEVLDRQWRMSFTSTHQRFQRLLKGYVEEARLGKVITCVCDLRLLGLVEGDAVRVASDLFPEMNGIYRVANWRLADDRTAVAFTLREYDPDAARDWDKSEEQEFELEVEGL